MVRLGLVFFFLLITVSVAMSQNTATTTGLWSDGSIWSAGTAPASTETVNADYSLTIDQNIVVTTGTFNFGASGGSNEFITDQPGGTAYTLTASTAGGTINVLDGVTTFEGAGLFDNCTLVISAGATLILGTTQFENQTTVIVNGTLIINGDLNNNNNGTGSFTIGNGGLVQVNGNYEASTGNVDVTGGGDLFTTGSLETIGSSDIFGNTNDCPTGPCSGRNLCGYSLSISANQVICFGSTPAVLTSSTSATGTLTYQWQRNGTAAGFSNATSGSPPVATGSIALGTSTASSYTIDPSYYAATGNDYFRLYMYDSNTACGAFSSSVLLVVVPTAGWIGNTNDWNTNSNWCDNTVPTSTVSATIASFPSGSTKFMPVISSTADIRNLTINSGASVTLTGTGSLNIFGNLDNDGLFTSSGTTTFAATNRVQTIGGDASTVFNNLTINNTFATQPAISLLSSFAVQGTLTLTSGRVDLSSNTLSIGISASTPGTVSSSGSSWLYNGNVVKYTPSTAVAFGSGNDLLPIGDATDYRPIQVAHSAIGNGGYVRVTHSSTWGSTLSAFSDTDAAAIQAISNSYWTIAAGGFSGVGGTPFTLRASGTNFGLIGDINHLRLVETSGGMTGSTPGTNSGTISNPVVERSSVSLANISTKTIRFGTTNYFYTSLPVTLLYFNAKLKNDRVELDWATSEEEDFDHFEIERAGSDLRFTTLTDVPGTGYNTSSKREYFATDENPLLGINYYRLKAVDVDGSYEYFSVKSVENNGNKKLVVSPNPASGNLLKYSINFEPGPYDRIVLINQVGTELFSIPVTATESELNLDSRLKPGAYLLRYISPDFQLVFRVFIKD